MTRAGASGFRELDQTLFSAGFFISTTITSRPITLMWIALARICGPHQAKIPRLAGKIDQGARRSTGETCIETITCSNLQATLSRSLGSSPSAFTLDPADDDFLHAGTYAEVIVLHPIYLVMSLILDDGFVVIDVIYGCVVIEMSRNPVVAFKRSYDQQFDRPRFLLTGAAAADYSGGTRKR